MDAFLSALTRAFEKSSRLLWPVRGGIWLRLFLLYLVTGTGGFHTGFRVPFSSLRSAPVSSVLSTAPTTPSKPTVSSDTVRRQWVRFQGVAKNLWENERPLLLYVAALVGTIVLILLVMLLWASARLEFVMIASLLNESVSLRRYWKQTERLGESYFAFRLAVFFVSLLTVAVTIVFFGRILRPLGWPPAWAQLRPLLLSSALVIGSGVAALILLMIVELFLPIVMFVSDQTTLPALGRALRFCFKHPVQVIGFFMGYAVVSIAVSVAITMASGIAALMLAGLLFPLLFLLKFPGLVGKIWLVGAGALGATAAAFFLLVAATVPADTLLVSLRIALVNEAAKRTT